MKDLPSDMDGNHIQYLIEDETRDFDEEKWDVLNSYLSREDIRKEMKKSVFSFDDLVEESGLVEQSNTTQKSKPQNSAIKRHKTRTANKNAAKQRKKNRKKR